MSRPQRFLLRAALCSTLHLASAGTEFWVFRPRPAPLASFIKKHTSTEPNAPEIAQLSRPGDARPLPRGFHARKLSRRVAFSGQSLWFVRWCDVDPHLPGMCVITRTDAVRTLTSTLPIEVTSVGYR